MSRARVGGGVLLAIAVVLTALNLRPAITSVGAVLDQMRVGLGATNTWAGLLTTLPGLCFAAASPAAPALSRRFGLGPAIGIALAVLSAGLVLRVLGGTSVVLGGTFVACGGIALANVLLPVVVKSVFAARVGLMTGIYTAALQAGGALGSAATPPLGGMLGGWRGALVSWAVLAATALLVWTVAARAPVLRGAGPAGVPESGDPPAGAASEDPASGAPASGRAVPARRSLLRSPLAWVVTVFFGSQACLAYIVMGWLPQVLMDAGVPRTQAGLMVGLVSLLGIPVSLVVPALAARQGSQSGWIAGLSAFGVAGVLGLMTVPGYSPLLWSVFVGVGMSVFSLALTTIALRARTSTDTASLSGMAQGFGYLLAALGPFLFGLLHDVTGDWTVSFALLLAVLLVQIAFGWLAGRPRYV